MNIAECAWVSALRLSVSVFLQLSFLTSLHNAGLWAQLLRLALLANAALKNTLCLEINIYKTYVY